MRSVKPLVIALLLPCIICTTALAWKPYGSGYGNHGSPGGGNSVPIDGGITLLLAAGLGLGAKKLYDRKKKKDEAAKDQ
jgi:hypothetical protein